MDSGDSSDSVDTTASDSGSSGGFSSSDGGQSGARSGRRSQDQGRAQAGQYVCVFWLSGQRFAVDAVVVGEVVAVPQVMPVPATPDWLVGLCNLRGVALAVLDLGGVLQLPLAAAAP